MLRTLNPVADVVLPDWSNVLVNHYWHIRVEGRDTAKRRRYYRLVEREKLRLAEQNLNQELIKAVCRYLINFNVVSGLKVSQLMKSAEVQICFQFVYG